MNANKKTEVRFKTLTTALISLWLFCPGQSAVAQNYDAAAGLRFSYGGLLSYKHRLHNNIYGEGILSFRWGGAKVTGLVEWHLPAFDTERLHWYGGGGMHVGYHYRNNKINAEPSDDVAQQINLGLDAIGGLEYALKSFPILISVSYKPGIEFTGRRWFIGEGIAFTAAVYW